MSERVRTGYMCSVELDHHLEHDWDGASVYPSEEACRDQCRCTLVQPGRNHCGIYKVKVEVVETVQEERMEWELAEPLKR